MTSTNFALIGAAGYIAPRHFKAIYDTGHKLLAATDPHDSVGILDKYFPDARFFPEIERFDRYLEKLRRQSEKERVHYISICSPNYLHDAHVRLALRLRANAICEKPLVINPWNIDALAGLEDEFGCKVYTVLQLRLLPALARLKNDLENGVRREKADICLTYVTRRGAWYHASWKGDSAKSGGLAMNIGVHFFDLLLWLFGGCERSELHLQRPDKLAGLLELERATVKWFLSVDQADLPSGFLEGGKAAFRSLTINGEEIEFSSGFTDLHTEVYRDILAGRGFGLQDVKPSIELVHLIRESDEQPYLDRAHPKLTTKKYSD
jgi:UDP-N-acetyl-2-amino-2-deoxyglucuronate dehydrogenase